MICSNSGPIIGLPGFSLCALGSLLGSIVTLTMLLYSPCSTRRTSTTPTSTTIITVIIIPYLQYTDWEHIDDGYLNQKMIGDVVGDFFFVCPCNYFAQQVGSSFLFCLHSKMNKSSLHFIHLVTQLELNSFISILTFTQYAEHGNPVYYYYFNQVCLDIADLLAMCFLVLSWNTTKNENPKRDELSRAIN